MKLTKKKEHEIMQVYDTWMHSYLNGDVLTYDSYFADEYHFIGSTDNEEFLNRKDTTQFFKDTAEQFSGKTDLRNQTKTIEAFDDLIFITHLFDAWFINGSDWTYYGRFRFSSVLHEKKEGWKFIYQHFSIADGKTDEGETIGFDKVNAENQELREAIKRRTVELEQKNRELEIETALEKVRAKSMGMYKSEELADLSLELVKQVQNLGVATWFCAFNIYEEDPKGSIEWGSNGQGTFPKYRTPREGIFLRYYKAGQKGESLHINEIEKNECATHYEYLCTLPGVGDQLLKMKEDGIPFPKSQIDHVAYFKYGYVLFITYEPVPGSHDIFKRFAKVFEQTYTRFLDLQKAEVQAREAEIELALERVRARTMAMHKSEELKDVIQVVNDQFVHLKINTEHTGFVMDYKARNDYDIWIADQLEVPSHVTIPYFDCIYYNRFNEATKKGEDFFATNLTFKEKNKFYKKLIEYIPDLPEETMEFLFSVPGLAASTVLLDNVCLYIENFEGIPYTDEENSILMRFGKVFQQTYTRFLDLQKAEAQARDAQIEASLERVRSRSMAMHSSEELTDAGALLYQELSKLGIQNLTTGYTLFDETVTMGWNYGVNPADGSIRHKPVGMNHTKTKVMKAIASSWKKQEPLLVIQLNERETIKHQTFIAEESIDFPISKERLLSISPKRLVVHTFNFKQGYLLIVGGELLTFEQQE
ncbi:MAG: nuclear transport factor 2 family protein, partial [Maribacter sp.]|uniref:nuclear transport factor 2 family protein n=1 Tax=Maribacter sp. TaxID=1897614 RepID=UPI003C72F635